MNTSLDIMRSAFANPWREIANLQRRMDRLFGELTSVADNGTKTEFGFLPSCDLEEKEDQYLISMDIPGIPKDRINIELTGNTLTVSGERKEEHEEGKGRRKVFERYYGNFERSFTLPDMIDAEKIEAQYQDGVLKISVPKQAAAQTRRISIGGAKTEAIGGKSGEAKKGEKAGEARAA